ncbi:MAG: hypothetical protein RLZZ36_1633, partial [Pseudomonadota bacterium]
EAVQTNNIRRVSMEVCDKASQKVIAQLQPEFQSEASDCALAKDQLVAATSSEAIDLAIPRSRFSATTEIVSRCRQGATEHEGGSEC